MNEIFPLEMRIRAFAELGKVIGHAAENMIACQPGFAEEFPALHEALEKASFQNPWFTPSNISFSLKTWNEALQEEALRIWLKPYETGLQADSPVRVAVVMAGNIPLVGFHDFLCVLLSGKHFIGKLSSDDKIILPALAGVLCQFEPRFRPMIQFAEGTLSNFDAIIATGSNNTARYFEYYFSKHPHIIRKNRNGVAVLSGNESESSIIQLGKDICSYFGLGCRNVSKVFIPEGFPPEKLFMAVEPYISVLADHNKYMNNHSYQHSVFLLNKTPHLDNGVLLLTESTLYSSPIAVLYYEYYSDADTLLSKLLKDKEFIQCIVNESHKYIKPVPFGNSQQPGLEDYADGIDTMQFLVGL